jgi:hypothetical protein
MKAYKNTDKIPADHELRLSAKDKTEGGHFTWEKKIDVVTKYMALGNARLVSELTKVPYITLMGWKKEPWWAELIEEVRRTRQGELNTKLSKIVDKSLSVIEDRLENGDIILNNKTGDLIRKPVSLRDANSVTKDLLAHQVRVEELTQKMEVQKDSVQDQLKLLATEFAKWSRKLVHTSATDIPFKETSLAIHDERET